MCVRGQNLPVSDCHVAPEPEQNPQFFPSASDHHIAPDVQYSISENMCHTLIAFILCWIIPIARYFILLDI